MPGDVRRFGGKKGGRPKGSKASHTLKAEQMRARLVERVAQELEPLLTSQLDAATGLWFDDQEKKRVYKVKPDVNAARNLLDQSIGKAKETVEQLGHFTLKIDF